MQAAREREEKKKIQHCNVVQTDAGADSGVDAGVGVGVDAVVDAGVLVGVAANPCGWQPSWSELVLQATENSTPAASASLGARKITPSLEICNGHISWLLSSPRGRRTCKNSSNFLPLFHHYHP